MAKFLYIHIPYCIRKCIYCDFFSLPFDEHEAQRYVRSLCRELEIRRDVAGKLRTIYIGGGTPTLLPEDCLKMLFRCLSRNFDFSPEIEISAEANPGTVNASKTENLLSLGINRMSVGIQSFHDDELKTLGRIHTADEALEAIDVLKKAGMKNFSIDLMYGIPGQTMETWKKTLSQATSLLPAHISSYELTPEEGTPISRLIKEHTIRMPEEDLILEMYSHAIDFLKSKGYQHYEISNFALPGARCVHNLNYWDRGEYIGAGAGAHSFIQGVRSRNTDHISVYIDSLTNDIIPEAGTTIINTEEALKEFIFLGLRKTEGIVLKEAEKMKPDFIGACAELIDSGHLAVKGDHLRITHKGLPLSNMVIVRLFERLGL